MSGVIYLSIPYRWKEQLSFDTACEVTSHLMRMGNVVVCPAIQTHIVKNMVGTNIEDDNLLEHNLEVLKHCDIMAVVVIDEWYTSKEMKAELEHAEECRIPIIYLEPDILFPGRSWEE